jgi:hypothetical protein
MRCQQVRRTRPNSRHMTMPRLLPRSRKFSCKKPQTSPEGTAHWRNIFMEYCHQDTALPTAPPHFHERVEMCQFRCAQNVQWHRPEIGIISDENRVPFGKPGLTNTLPAWIASPINHSRPTGKGRIMLNKALPGPATECAKSGTSRPCKLPDRHGLSIPK